MRKPKPITATSAADLVRQCRLAAGYATIYAAGKATGLATSTLDRIEHGQQIPTVEAMRGILKAFGFRLVIEARNE
jgi:transcriptional regulator with XRE-family HTH domain